MRVIGLTGGIGMGKSTAATAFRRAHIPVFDADATVHRLQAPGGRALRAIAATFPRAVRTDARDRPVLDRAALRDIALADPGALRRLEQILHPMVYEEARAFLARARRARARIAVLDIPLLFETGGRIRTDLVLVVSAPASVQINRVARRRRMDPAQVRAVLARQMPDAEKRRRADVVVRTGLSKHHALRAIRRLIRRLRG
ncbi:dephospho-CoA kinase [Rhodovastum atsumiense]|uniref:Dephospho-CoA kinase n=1 Tax=Rhodovastum atsumiense TaxID=504468 RepID=A0A5M6IY99_9PROT|nr:dephospho-CoA kinase [Rhodovastum atsumiense]KAA5613320.1 dephospho-CoA kinase [Rhodovastum atsumiense]